MKRVGVDLPFFLAGFIIEMTAWRLVGVVTLVVLLVGCVAGNNPGWMIDACAQPVPPLGSVQWQLYPSIRNFTTYNGLHSATEKMEVSACYNSSHLALHWQVHEKHAYSPYMQCNDPLYKYFFCNGR